MVLAFGSLGCNMGCRMCHNNFMTQSIEQHQGNLIQFTAGEIADLAVNKGARAVVFTYNDPAPQVEWVRDVASACKDRGLKTLLCTAGYVSRKYRDHLFELVDAVELSLKGFYHKSHYAMARVSSSTPLETLEYLARSSKWLEVTITVVPTYNDSPLELRRYMDWHVEHLGVDVPLRFAKFRPAHELEHIRETAENDLFLLRKDAEQRGIRYVYVGNVNSPDNQTTFCSGCGRALIERDWFRLVSYNAVRDTCPNCGTRVPGIFEQDAPVQQLAGKREIIEVKGP